MSLTFDVPRAIILTANQRLHWAAKASRTRDLRDTAAMLKRSMDPDARFERAHCVVEIGFSTNARRDVANWAPTVKAQIDGMVSGPTSWRGEPWPWALLPDDDHTHLVGPDLRISPDRTPPGTVRFTYRFEEVAA